MTTPNPDDFFGPAGGSEPKGKRSINPDDYFGPVVAEKPKTEKKPGLIKRGLAALSAVTPEPPREGPRRGGTPAEMRQGAFGADEPRTAQQPLPDGVPASAAGAGRGMVNPPEAQDFGLSDGLGASVSPESAQAIRLAPDDMAGGNPLTFNQVGRDLRGGVEQVKGLATGAAAFGGAVDWRAASQTLADLDQIDAGQPPTRTVSQQMGLDGRPRQGAPNPVVQAYMGGDPAAKQKIRASLAQGLQRDQTFIAESVKAIQGYNAEQKRLSGKMPDFTDIRTATDFARWAVRNGVATAPTMAASMLGAVLGPAGLAVTSGAMAVGDMTSARAEFAGRAFDPARFTSPDRHDDAGAARDGQVAQHLADNVGATAAMAVPYAALDFLGPAGTLAMGGAKGLAKQGAKAILKKGAQEVGEEAINEGGQEVINIGSDIAANERQATLTAEDAKRVGNAAAVGGLMGGAGHAANVTGDAARNAYNSPERLIARAIDEAAAQYGLNTKAAAKLREKTTGMDADTAAAYVERVFGGAERAGLVKKPGGGGAFRQNLKDLAEQATKDAEAQQGETTNAGSSGDSNPAVAAAPSLEQQLSDSVASDLGLADELDAGAILGTQAEAPPATSGEAPTEGATNGPMTDEPAQPGVEAGAAPPTPVDEAAHEAATSPHNDHPEPTLAQKEAGNYRKGAARIAGMNVSIENPEGSVRRGVARDGTPWENTMVAHYGYVRGTRAGDGDHSDIFIKPGTPEDYSGPAYVIDQIDPETGKFDEHKTVLGASSEDEARAIYQANYAPGWKGLAAITQLPIDAYKSWVRDGVKRKPLGDINAVSGNGARPDGGRSAQPGPADARDERGTGALVPGELQQPGASGVAGAAVPDAGSRGVPGADRPGDGDEALKPGQSVTVDGKPYTVKTARPKSIVLTDPAGKPRTITSDSANWGKVKPAVVKQSLTTGPAAEEFAGQMGEGMAEHVAKAQQKRLSRERPELEWTVTEADAARNPKLKADRYVVQGRAPVAQAKPDQEAAPARSVEPAGATAAPAVPAAGSAAVEAAGLKKSKSKPPKEKKAKAVMGSWPLGHIVHSLGGIGMGLRSDLSSKAQRTRTNKKTGKVTHYTDWRGNGLLFRERGSTDLTEMARILEEAGYMEPGLVKRDYLEATSQVQDIIKAEIANPGSTEPAYSDDFDAIMQRQREARDEADREAALIESFSVDDMDQAGAGEYDAEQQAVLAQLTEEAEAAGIDVDTLREQFYDDANPEWSQQEYDQALIEAIRRVLPGAGGQVQQPVPDSRGKGQGDQGGVEADPVAPGAGSDRADGPDQAVQAEGLTLHRETIAEASAKMERERKALADEAKAQAAEQARLEKEALATETRKRADSSVDEFQLGQSADQQLSGQKDIFSAPAKLEAKQEPEAAPAAPAEPMAPENVLDAETSLWARITEGKATPEEFKAGFERWVSSKGEITAALLKNKKDDLLKMGGSMFAYRYKADTKPEIVDALWRDGASQYTLARSFQYGMGKDAYINGIRKMVDATDADQLAQYAADHKASQGEAVARVAKTVEAIKDPKTLDDYRTWMRATMSGGKTFAEARMMLTPEQRAAYDDLQATDTRGSRKSNTDIEKTKVRVAGQTVDGDIIATKHTKKGHDLFVVQLAERVSREDYETLSTGAKRIGGYYSSFKGGGAIPGFQFTTRDQAQAFVQLAQGDNAAAIEAAQERRDSFADDRSQTAAQRLTEMADRLEEQAEESMGRERKANTERRARFAANADAAARAQQAMAKTMRNIAGAIDAGTAKFLDRVRQRVQVELLQTYVRTAKGDELRAKHDSYVDQQRHEGEPPTGETADFATFPAFTAYRSDLASLGRQLLEVDGTKKLGQQIMKVADDISDAFTKFAKEPGNLMRLGTFSSKTGERPAFPTQDQAQRAIDRSGYQGKAIPWSVKRGEWTVIMSPSEAMARGIWKGDGDKRITLDADFGAELVEKIGRAARRGQKVSVPWQFESAYDRRKAMSRMGIETPAEFRAALREFIGLREQAAAPDKVKELERAMVGRRNDGMDFFPTPESTADEMVSAADIQPGMRVLEPSAGMGHIAERIRAAGVEPVVGEISNDRRELLEAKGFEVVGRDFMDVTEGGYDRIVLNPPFSDGRDIQHVRHAFDLLKPGGRLVAIMGESAFTNQNKRATEFREWLDQIGGTEEKLAEGTFNDPSLPVNTGANARMVVIDKPEGATPLLSQSPAKTFYSALSRAIEGVAMKQGSAGAWGQFLKGMVASGKVKADELEWSGLSEWLNLQPGKVSKEQIADYLAANGVQVTETVLDDQIDPSSSLSTASKYSQYTLPGGTNYREVLLTLPEDSKAKTQKLADMDAEITRLEQEGDPRWRDLSKERGRLLLTKPAYKSGHWDQPNVLAHIRVNDRVDADGNRVLFVEEIQSDWGQAGKKQGFQANDTARTPTTATFNEVGYWEVTDQNGQFLANVNSHEIGNSSEAALREVARRMTEQRVGSFAADRRVPLAPFVTHTDKWLALALKRIVKIAVDEGYDRVAFVNGEQSAERYDMSKQVDSITARALDGGKFIVYANKGGEQVVQRVVTRDEMPDFIGKDLSKRILDDYGMHTLGQGVFNKTYRGLDLKIGGEGMRAFYDKIVPAALKDVLKKVGGGTARPINLGDGYRIETTRVGQRTSFDVVSNNTRDDSPVFSARTMGEVDDWMAEHSAQEGGRLTQTGFDVTPAMRAKAADGLPLFKTKASTTGTDQAKLTTMVENIRAGWADAPPVTVVATTWDLPGSIVADLRSMNAVGTVRALVMPDTGKVYLIADRLPSMEEAQAVLFHEVLGHYGLRKFLGADYEKTMRQMRAMNAGLRAESRAWMTAYGKGQIEARVKRGMSYADATVEVDLLSVEEALADRAGNPEPISGFKRLVAKLQAWLRDHGFMGAAQWLEGKTQAQVLSLLQSARDAVEKADGVHAYTGGAMMAASSPAGITDFAANKAFRSMVSKADDDLHSVLFNWNESELRDGKIIGYPGRDSYKTMGSAEGGKMSLPKREFIAWLMSDAPFDTATYGPSIEQDEEWSGQIGRLREIARQVLPALSQMDQTETPEFRKWFGASKVVDAEGKPLRVYHGTKAEFTEFKRTKSGEFGPAIYLTDNPREAGEYGDGKGWGGPSGTAVMPLYVSIQNPYTEGVDAFWKEFGGADSDAAALDRAQAAGYDGIIAKRADRYYDNAAREFVDRGETLTHFIAFKPEQVKSAIGNSGAFDPSNPSILLSQIQHGNIPGTSDTEQEAIAKGYKARVKRALKRADGVINGLGELPDTEQYLGQRYLALGKIAAVDKIAGDIRAAFRKASPADKRAIYAYLTTAGANTDGIADPETKTMAAKVKRYIGTVGDQLVARGLISEESREAYRDAYLPRLYLAHLLSDGDWRAIGAGKKVSDMGYLKARKDIPQEIRDVILGEVKDPAFLAATAIAKPMRDMALLDWLAQISENQQWVLANSMTEWNGKRVSVFWLKAEADALRTRAVHYPDAANRDKAMSVANAMDAAAVEAMDGADFNHKDYKQIPNTPKYGRLRGIYVRTEIYNDLMGAQDFMPTDPGWAQKILGYGGIGTKVTQLWKMSKVALNPPGQVRNAMANGIMLQLSGVPMHMLPILMGRAIRQIRHGGKHWQIAKKYGVTESTFQAQEMFRAQRDLIELERELKGLTPLVALKTVGAVISDAAGDAYQFTEALFKTVKIMDAMEREGMDEEAAAIEAQKWLFDYSLVDKNVRYLRNAPVGAPFLTYTTKVLPRLAEVALLHPQRFLPWVALMYGMQAWAQAMFGGDDDEWDELKKAVPKWMQEKGHIAFLPWRDDAGRLQAVDMSYFFPWSQWAEFASSLTEGDLKGATKAMGLFGGPVTSIINAWATGKDSFTGRDIINEGDPTSYQAASLLAYAWDMAMPPMMTSNGVVSPMWLLDPQYGGKLAQASTGATNRMGDQKATYGQAASRIVGFNTYGIDPEVTRTSNLIGMKADIAKARAALRSKLGNQGLTPDQQRKLIEDYTVEMTKRAKEMKKYAEESTVPDFAKREKVTE